MQLSTTAIPAHEKGAREPLTLYYLVFVFTVCSILGLILETIVSYFVDGRWESRVGFIWGPFSPIYGVGGVLITLALHRFENASPLVIYAVSAAFGAAFEYFAAWFWESAFGIVAWSYINQPFNIGGKSPRLGIALVWATCGPCVATARRPRAERSLENGTTCLARTPCLGAAYFLSRRCRHNYARSRLLDVSLERP